MFIAPNFDIHPAPLGAECKLHLSNDMALRWSAGLLRVRAINIVLLRSTSRLKFSTKHFSGKASQGYKHGAPPSTFPS